MLPGNSDEYIKPCLILLVITIIVGIVLSFLDKPLVQPSARVTGKWSATSPSVASNYVNGSFLSSYFSQKATKDGVIGDHSISIIGVLIRVDGQKEILLTGKVKDERQVIEALKLTDALRTHQRP